VTYEDEYVASIGDDGLVILWKLQEISVSKKEREIVYAEEILITKSDLEEKVADSSLHLSRPHSRGPRMFSFEN
jgi:hypothetical protein